MHLWNEKELNDTVRRMIQKLNNLFHSCFFAFAEVSSQLAHNMCHELFHVMFLLFCCCCCGCCCNIIIILFHRKYVYSIDVFVCMSWYCYYMNDNIDRILEKISYAMAF